MLSRRHRRLLGYVKRGILAGLERWVGAGRQEWSCQSAFDATVDRQQRQAVPSRAANGRCAVISGGGELRGRSPPVRRYQGLPGRAASGLGPHGYLDQGPATNGSTSHERADR
jgi:hypothetical protein